MRRAETKVVDADHKKPYYDDDILDYDSISHLESLVSRYKVPNIYAHKVSTSGEPADKTSANNRIKTNGKETHGGDLVLQNSRYKVINNRVYRVPSNPARVDMPSASACGSSKKALAGLIFMSNEKVRRSSFNYGVLCMPIAKKPILDRVEPGTKLFLFEFEARVLWGIYEATSEASLDIEKDAYRGSEVPFPAQVKFRVYKQSRPLPERIFQPAIEDNYFTPTKFNFELTEKQVSKLTTLYSVREIDIVRVDGRALSAAQNSIPYETDGVRGDDRAISTAAQNNNPYKIDSVRVDARAISVAQNSIPYVARIQDAGRLDRLLNAREGLVKSGNMAASNLVVSRYIGKDKRDTLKSASMNCKDYPIPSREKHFQDIIQDDLNGGLSLCNSRPASMSYPYAGTKPFLPEDTATNINLYSVKDEILSEDDLRHQIRKAELPQHAGDSTCEPRRQGMIDYFKDSPVTVVDLCDAVSESKRSLEGPLEEDYHLCKLKMKHLNDRVLVRQPPSSSDEHGRSERYDYSALHGNTRSNFINASQAIQVKCYSNDLQPAVTKKVRINKDDLPQAQKSTASYKDHVYAREFASAQDPRQRFRDGFPSYNEAMQDVHRNEAMQDVQWATKEVLEPCSTTHKPTPTYPVKVSADDDADHEVHERKTHDFLPLLENDYLTPILVKTSTHPMTSTVPDDKAWPENHAHVAESFATRSNASSHPRTLTVPDVGNHSNAAKGFATRSDTVEDDNKAWVENATSVAKSFTTRSNTVENDDKAWVGNTKCAANSFVPRSYDVEDDEAWLEKARSVVANSFISRSNNNVENSYKKGEQNTPVQVENQVQRSLLRILGKRPQFAASSHLLAGNDNVKPRRSVWLRLSAPRKTLNPRQISKELVLPNEDLGELQLSRGSLPWKSRVMSTRTYQKHPTGYEVGGKDSDMEECLGTDEKELNVDFKRGKSILSKADPSSKPHHSRASVVSNEQMGTVMKGINNPLGDDYDNQRDRRRIKRPLLTSGKQSI